MFFPLALPFKVCECDVFMAVLPVHTIAPCFHLVYEVLSACGYFSAIHDRKGCILHITFHFSLFGLLQEVVCFFVPRNRFFPFLSGKGLSFLRNMKPLLPALLIAPVFQVLQIRFAPLQLVSVLKVHTVYDKVSVYVSSVYMGGNEYLMPFPCFRTLGKLDCVLMCLLWCDICASSSSDTLITICFGLVLFIDEVLSFLYPLLNEFDFLVHVRLFLWLPVRSHVFQFFQCFF